MNSVIGSKIMVGSRVVGGRGGKGVVKKIAADRVTVKCDDGETRVIPALSLTILYPVALGDELIPELVDWLAILGCQPDIEDALETLDGFYQIWTIEQMRKASRLLKNTHPEEYGRVADLVARRKSRDMVEVTTQRVIDFFGGERVAPP